MDGVTRSARGLEAIRYRRKPLFDHLGLRPMWVKIFPCEILPNPSHCGDFLLALPGVRRDTTARIQTEVRPDNRDESLQVGGRHSRRQFEAWPISPRRGSQNYGSA